MTGYCEHHDNDPNLQYCESCRKQSAREASEAWLRANDWDYRKYRDRRPDRSAYGTHMNYEISDLLAWAFEAGAAFQRERDAEITLELGKSVKGGYNNAAFEIAEAIREQEEGQK